MRDDTDNNIMHLLCNGLTNREISDSLGITYGAVTNRIKMLMASEHARNRTHLASMAAREQAREQAPRSARWASNDTGDL